MPNHTYFLPGTERTRVPENAAMDSRITDTDPGEVLLELDMIGIDNRKLVIAMTGTLDDVRADIDTLRVAIEGASKRLEEREFLAAHGLGGV